MQLCTPGLPFAARRSTPAPMTDHPELAPRVAALEVLATALARRAGLDEALSGKAMAGLAPRDRAFARALAMAALRHLGPIDRALDARLAKPPPDRVRDILRLGLAQILHLDTPAFAAVDSSVALAAADPATRLFKGLVNAVLRGLLRDPPAAPAVDTLAPDRLHARWRAAYGEDAAARIAGLIPEEPATDLSLRDPADAPALAEALPGELLPGGSLRAERRGDLASWPGFAEGGWWVQDAAAAVPARLLAVQPGETALDLCAAPGGKTLQLAAAGGTVVAVDRSAARLRRVAENLTRTNLTAETVVADAARWNDDRSFDAVLLDAPCSATGTFRRHPDVLWIARPGDIAKLAEVQARLLDAAVVRVKPGGRLVYCVCSLEPEEGERQAEAFLTRHPEFHTVSAAPGEGGAPPESLTSEGWLRLLPHQRPGGQDGFFAARFARDG